MRCSKCGFDNAKHSKFCGDCGNPLSFTEDITNPMPPVRNYPPNNYDSYVADQRPSPNFMQKHKILFIAILTALLVTLAFSFFFFFNDGNPFSGKARAYKEIVTKGQAAYDSKSYEEAIDILGLVPEDAGKSYEEAQGLLKQVELELANELSAKYSAGEYWAVLDSANTYLETFPNNESFKSLAKQADNEIRYMESESLKAKEAELDAQIEAAKKAAAKAESAASRAKAKSSSSKPSSSSYLNTSQTVQTNNANVRSGPGLDYPSIYVLNKGDQVYISDTLEAGIRTWCYIGDGWISSRTLNGEL